EPSRETNPDTPASAQATTSCSMSETAMATILRSGRAWRTTNSVSSPPGAPTSSSTTSGRAAAIYVGDIVRSAESATASEGCCESDRTSPSRSRRRSLTMRTVGPGCWRFDLGRVCSADPTIVSAPCVSMTQPYGTRDLEQLESRQRCVKFLMTRLMRLSRAGFDFVIRSDLRERGSALENRAKSYFGRL